MTEREDTIERIERVLKLTNKKSITVTIPRLTAELAVSILKAQEPRVMTYGEMMKAEICFLEVKGIEEIDPFIRFEVDGKSYWSSPYTNNKENPFELLAEQEEYSINARCWTSRPTDEKREATPWHEPPKEGTWK